MAVPKEKRRKLSLLLLKDWLNFSVEDEELKEAMKGYCCKNMIQSNKWAIKNFLQWFMEGNRSIGLQDIL